MHSLDEVLSDNPVFHKEKNQKKNNITTGQYDNLRGYNTHQALSTDNLSTDDKQIRREARLLKNIHIDHALERLRSAGFVNEGYDAWYCKVMHSLGVPKVEALAQISLDKCRAGSTPQALFHFLLNKELNKVTDPYMPRFNKRP
jgi:hypothetical protein